MSNDTLFQAEMLWSEVGSTNFLTTWKLPETWAQLFETNDDVS